MSVFISVNNLSKAYGSHILFDDLSLSIHQGDRIGLIGPNGSGKSTLLKILAGIDKADSGEIVSKKNLRIGYVSQVPEFPNLPLEELLIKSAGNLEEYEASTRAKVLLGKLGFSDFSKLSDELSGGWKKRLDLARALMKEPDLLLLDEPTNHLDLEGILWLEEFLAREQVSYLVISHDRYFLENIASKIVEINRCFAKGSFVVKGKYSQFMEEKEEYLLAEEGRRQGLSSVVRQETEWLKRSPKARTTKSQSRVKNAYAMQKELSDLKRRHTSSKVAIQFTSSERETRKLLVANNLTKSLGGRQLFKGIDLTLSPGSRVGILGKNGTGKTTLLRMFAGEVMPDLGTIKYADELRSVYFDQHREKIDPELTLKEALSPGGDFVHYHGKTLHVNGWAERFLFSKERMSLPVKYLSGGERARILIARLMLTTADLLFLDEPTNDLDIPTLEVMEESLLEFPGAVVLITHDRCLMERVCTTMVGLGEGVDDQCFADYGQWEKSLLKKEKKSAIEASEPKEVKKKKNLSYKEKKELENMDRAITDLEEKIEGMHEELATLGSEATQKEYQLLAEEEEKLEKLYSYWQDLLDRA